MLQVPQQQYIKFLYENEGWSVSDIARHMGIDWRTADKYASRDDWNEVISKRMKSHPVMGPYIDIVDTWLLEDERIPRKQRHITERKVLTMSFPYSNAAFVFPVQKENTESFLDAKDIDPKDKKIKHLHDETGVQKTHDPSRTQCPEGLTARTNRCNISTHHSPYIDSQQ
jgi:hypothetical protein